MKFLGLLLIAMLAAAQAPAPQEVPVTQEPSHHLVFANQYTRAFQVAVPAGKATLLHRHDHDYVFVVLGDAEISNEVLGKPPAQQKLKNGEVRFAPGGFAHVARNLAPTPFRNVTIEVLRKSKSIAPASPCGGAAGECTILDSDAVKVRTENLMPGVAIAKHRHVRDHMMVAVSDLHMKSDVTGKGSSDIRQKAGDVLWVKGGFEHTLTNVGPQPARFVVLEFK